MDGERFIGMAGDGVTATATPLISLSASLAPTSTQGTQFPENYESQPPQDKVEKFSVPD